MTTTLLYGDLRTGRIIDTLDATSCNWRQVLNDAGAVDQVTVQGHEVRRKDLRRSAPAAKTFLAVDVDGVLQEAGPIWSRVWDDQAQELTLGAAGLWSLFDHRNVMALQATTGIDPQKSLISVAQASFGGIAKEIVRLNFVYADDSLPLYAGAGDVAGDRTETFYGWQLPNLGEQLRQLTTRENGPDIRFAPRYTADRLSIQWVMDTGTEAAPQLAQVGDDWYFDATVAKSPVVNIHTDEDATVMGMRAWVTGNGSEEDMLMAVAYDPTLVDAGWPLLEVDEARSTTELLPTLQGHAQNFLSRSARPIEVWNVVVRPEAAAQVLAGDYCRVVVGEKHPWLPTGEAFMRVKQKSGGLTGDVTLQMYAVQAVL